MHKFQKKADFLKDLQKNPVLNNYLIFLSFILFYILTVIDWLKQEELQEVPPKNSYFQIDHWI